MKILTTEGGKIISYGQFVFATGENEVVDVNEEMTIATIKDIAKLNGCSITAKKKDDVISQLQTYLNENYHEVTEMTDEQKFENIVVEGFEKEMSDNDIKKALFTAGCEFGDINKVFNKAVQDKGLRLSPKDRNEKAAEFLEGYVPTDVETHLAKLSALQDHLSIASTQAGAAMRAWAKVNEIELPKAPTVKTAPGYRGKKKILADWMIENKEATFDQLCAYASEAIEKTKEGKDASRNYAVDVWNAVIFAKSYAGIEEVEDESETESQEEVSEDEA